MSSYLETVPDNVLCHIAYLSAVSYVSKPPTDVFHLMLTSRTIYHGLAVSSCSRLYADLFLAKFDIAAVKRRLRSTEMLTTSSLAAELVQRYSMLRRVRRRQMSDQNLSQDLFTAYMMILESDGLNEMQLAAVGFSDYVSTLARIRLSQRDARDVSTDGSDSLAVWALWFTLSRETIASQNVGKRNEMLDLLRPFAVFASMCVPDGMSRSSPQDPGRGNSRSQSASEIETNTLIVSGSPGAHKLVHYGRLLEPAWPKLSAASIILTFTLKEAQPLRIPPHLPRTRTIANATMRMGPTMEDYSSMARYRTLLISDTYHSTPSEESAPASQPRARSTVHDQDFARMAQVLDPFGKVFRSNMPFYVPGSLNGLWEGTWMASPSVASSSSAITSDFLCRQPMQCYLREHFCFSPNVPLPNSGFSAREEVSAGFWNLEPHQLVETQDGFTLQDTEGISTREYCYERDLHNGRSGSGRGLHEALDIVVTGETMQGHSMAWGEYRFAGKVRLGDGLIVLKREPGDGDDSLGTWFFEGYLHSEGAFVGRWYSNKAANQSGIGGIFSLGRSSDKRGE